MSVTPSQFDLIGKLLDASALRQRVTSQNIANVNTPGYKAREVNFEERLVQQLNDRDGEGPSPSITPEVKLQEGLSDRADGNNVEIDAELGKARKNELLHNAYARVLSSKISAMRSAITGR